jgi:UDP-GlcNAc:undecaprenyl-phosphate GlcNAc-1-phosphate transferase
MAFALGAITGMLALMVLLPLAWRWQWLDHPVGGRKDHAESTPIVGGLAVALGMTVAVLATGTDGGDLRALFALAAAGTLMLVMGFLDDLRDLHWTRRIGAQFVAALILIYGGGLSVNHFGELFGHPVTSLGWASVPFTVFMVVALINALNMIDGVDGLCGSVVLAGLAMFAAAALYAGDPALATVLLGVCGALAAFLWFNLRRPGQPRARVFLGNGGSALLGLVIAWASLRLSQNPAHPVTATLLPWLLVPPVIDAIALVIRRAAHGRSPFAGDRNHLHHIMLDAGFGPTQIVVGCTAASLGLGGAAALALQYDIFNHTALLVGYVLLSVGYFGLTYRRERAVAVFRAIHGGAATRAENVLEPEPVPAEPPQR